VKKESISDMSLQAIPSPKGRTWPWGIVYTCFPCGRADDLKEGVFVSNDLKIQES
jgi:hypothetical protein